MDVDPRRDHSLRVPRPDLSVELGTPNACSSCHVKDQLESIDAEKRETLVEYADWLQAAEGGDAQIAKAIKATDKWCDEACEKWYGENRQQPRHYGEAIAAFRKLGPDADPATQRKAIKGLLALAMTDDPNTPFIAKATAWTELSAAGVPANSDARKLIADPSEHPMVRAAAINAMRTADPKLIQRIILPLIKDPSRLVRIEATRLLVTSGAYQSLTRNEQREVDQSMDEVREALMAAADRAGAHLGWAMLSEARGNYAEAIEAYETAMRVEPKTTGPRTNLADLLERLAERVPPQQGAQLRSRAQSLRAEELPLLRRDADLAPDNAAVQYRFGLSLYLAGQLDEALQRISRAVELEPNVSDFRQFRDLLLEKMQK